MRFPLSPMRCDSPHRSPLEPGVAVVIEDPPTSRRPAGTIAGLLERMRGTIMRHRDSLASDSKALKSYTMGYIDASYFHGLYPSASPAKSRARNSSIVPASLQDTVLQYPLSSALALGVSIGIIATAGAMGGVALTRRALGRVASSPSMPPDMALQRFDALERRVAYEIRGAGAERRKEGEQLKKDMMDMIARRAPSSSVGSSVASPATAGGSGLEERVKGLEGQIVAANRDRRAELQMFRAELMGQLSVLEDLAKSTPSAPSSSAPPVPPVPLPKGNGKKAGEFGALAPIAPHMDEARLSQVLRAVVDDALEARLVDIRTTMHGIEDAVVEDLYNVTRQLDECYSVLTQLDSRVQGTPIESGTPSEASETPASELQSPKGETASADKAATATAPKYYPMPERSPQSENQQVEADTARSTLYDNIQAARDSNKQVLSRGPFGGNSLGRIGQMMTDMATDWDDVPPPSQVPGTKKSKAGPPPLEVDGASHTATSAQTSTTLGLQEAKVLRDTVMSFPINAHAPQWSQQVPPVAKSETVKEQKQGGGKKSKAAKAAAKEAASSSAATINPGPRLGIDDSGRWSFVLPNTPLMDVEGAGWKDADVFYTSSSSSRTKGKNFFVASSSSGTEVYSNVKIFFYPEFDIVRLDGQLWRCERDGKGKWIIREKHSEVKEPEWDGVGYEKD